MSMSHHWMRYDCSYNFFLPPFLNFITFPAIWGVPNTLQTSSEWTYSTSPLISTLIHPEWAGNIPASSKAHYSSSPFKRGEEPLKLILLAQKKGRDFDLYILFFFFLNSNSVEMDVARQVICQRRRSRYLSCEASRCCWMWWRVPACVVSTGVGDILFFLLLLLLDVHLGDRHGTVEGEDHLSRVTKVIFKVYLLCCTRRDERRYNGYTGEQLFGPRGSLYCGVVLLLVE